MIDTSPCVSRPREKVHDRILAAPFEIGQIRRMNNEHGMEQLLD